MRLRLSSFVNVLNQGIDLEAVSGRRINRESTGFSRLFMYSEQIAETVQKKYANFLLTAG
jgi:hypothetical protein